MDELFNYSDVIQQIASANSLNIKSVTAAAKLLDDGNTLPFIARYRKEATCGLDETALRAIEDGLSKSRELAARKKTILKTIDQQGALSDELRSSILACDDKHLLEDLYLPFKPKRRTKATIAKERGLEPLAKILLEQNRLGKTKRSVLAGFVDPKNGVPDAAAALEGAGHIVAEVWSESPETRQWLIEEAHSGKVFSKVKRGKKEEGSKFEMYFDFSEPIRRIASHRLLAIKRGESEKILRVGIELNDDYFIRQLKRRLVTEREFEFFHELLAMVEAAYQSHFLPAAAAALLARLKEQADEEAIGVFANNFRELLLAPPAGKQVTLGIDPGFRTGCKIAVVDETGKFLANKTIFPTAPKNDISGSSDVLRKLIDTYEVQLIAIGNGTASRETDAFVGTFIKQEKLDVTKAVVSESGASIYSASPLAVEEYPDLDVTVRGAISIAHRLQDPLAELVKIDAKSIGVGQYQHDVNQTLLKKSLDREVESCVNSVGVELNTASPRLLGYVSGIGPKVAEQIVKYRNQHGAFGARRDLLNVPKLGAMAFRQSAGFLRISDSDEPLDQTAVHPECYGLVNQMAQSLKVNSGRLISNEALLNQLEPSSFVDDKFGLMTVEDVVDELRKPGRDPRREFRSVKFDDHVNNVGDLREGMILQGQVTNVANFGAFVDIGVHQDGLVHISELANQFVQDPSEVVAVGDIVRVKVMQVDTQKNRIGLSIKQA